jgi:hypothetical protein
MVDVVDAVTGGLGVTLGRSLGVPLGVADGVRNVRVGDGVKVGGA